MGYYCSRFVNGEYLKPEKLDESINSEYVDAFPYIDPDERFLIFYSERPGGYCKDGELYISFRKNGRWTMAQNMGQQINTAFSRFPGMSPDGKYFFFSNQSSGSEDIYWMDASFIERLHTANL